jgi:ADP-ribose pyrophosphatase
LSIAKNKSHAQMNNKWKKISSRIAYKTPWLRIREDTVTRPNGKRGIYSIVERPNVNFVIAVIDDRILFIKEYRYPVKQSVWQLPAGTTNKKEGDLQAAKRELHQETGYRARKWKKIGSFFIAPGHESIVANVFLATKCYTADKQPIQSAVELITRIDGIPIRRLKKMIAGGKIKCGITLASLNIFFQTRK